ncbi:ras association domain-containing protein 7 [Bombina bombina]|uniref:ras association domain-containing protein 7 n=1 Tax=Bombina bombina TaxID=8345 RepID=UPI00235A4DDA|nr:ras association domain-containing protein 7 [Bombina bombina]XP_053576163.1 ras association domain-containing protein 7 [Bombina bombina]XP_053576164.1 ras association domain-containing protein 7 [Bombina bombina]XP_053576165.1 ras association domain-containing protein 7 [Bombina bombina]
MELKVWVDGVQRVVCGVSEQTSCQDVVIALAQAIGQTGRYILIQTFRDKERQLLPHEKPLEFLAKSGQYANDVQFILRRTGPSLTERPASDTTPLPPERTFVRSSLPLNPRTVTTDATRSKEPKKSLTFNLGSTSSSEVLTKHRQKQHNGVANKEGAPAKQPSKEEIFKMVLRQQEQLNSLEMQNDSLGKDIQTWERGRAGGPLEEEEDEVAFLERLIRRNEAELGEERFWLDELQRERLEEQERQERVRKLRVTMEEYTQKIQELSEKTETLELEIQREASKRVSGEPSQAELDEMVTKMRKELDAKNGQGHQLESNLANVEWACEEAMRNLQVRNQELEELNKDLRQCNLQQFILQTGSTVTNGQLRSDEESFPDPTDLQSSRHHKSRGPTDSPPQNTAKHVLSHSRNVKNTLVSSMKPEVLSSRETSWT